MNTPYRGLKIIGGILKFLGVVALSLAFISVVVAPLALSSSDGALGLLGLNTTLPGTGLLIGLLVGFILFFIGIASGMLLFAIGECFNVLIAIEANTRTTMELLQKK
jgi:hypothetical protein